MYIVFICGMEEVPHITDEELSHSNVYSVYMWYGGSATHN
jgi:hypothetical protein